MTEDYRCSVWTRQQGPDPVGSAPRFDHLILVEVPLPWPPDVADAPMVAAAAAAAAAAADGPTRVMAVVPDERRQVGDVLITSYRRHAGAGYVGTDILARTTDCNELLRALLEGERVEGDSSPAEVLLCGHGARDRCCGSQGTRLFVKVARSWPDVRIRRCSHTGGHRFAPTGMTLPDGHLWAYLDEGLLHSILTRTARPAHLKLHYRGSPILEAPWQILERALFERFGWDVFAWMSPRTDEGDGRQQLLFDGPERVVSVSGEVFVSRRLPVLACGESPDEAEKFSDEYAVRNLALA